MRATSSQKMLPNLLFFLDRLKPSIAILQATPSNSWTAKKILPGTQKKIHSWMSVTYLVDKLVPFWDLVPQRAPGLFLVAEWYAAVHATRTLCLEAPLVNRSIDLLKIFDALLRRPEGTGIRGLGFRSLMRSCEGPNVRVSNHVMPILRYRGAKHSANSRRSNQSNRIKMQSLRKHQKNQQKTGNQSSH